MQKQTYAFALDCLLYVLMKAGCLISREVPDTLYLLRLHGDFAFAGANKRAEMVVRASSR